MDKIITLTDEGIVFCGRILCDFYSFYKIGDVCEDCPLLKIHKELSNVDLNIKN